MPDMATLAAVAMVAAMMMNSGRRRALMPMVEASSSPMVSTLMRQRSTNRMTMPMAMGMAASAMSLIFAPVSEPMSQYVMAGSWSVGSATSLVNDTPAWNSELITGACEHGDQDAVALRAAADEQHQHDRQNGEAESRHGDGERAGADEDGDRRAERRSLACAEDVGDTSGFWNVP